MYIKNSTVEILKHINYTRVVFDVKGIKEREANIMIKK